LAQVAAIRANEMFRAGREWEAFQEALGLVRLGRRLQESRGRMIHYLVGSAVKAHGVQRMRGWVGSTRLTPQQLAIIVAELERIPADGTAAAETLKVEYQVTVATLSDVRAGRVRPGEWDSLVPIKYLPVYNHGKTKRLFANATRVVIDSLDVPYSQAKHPDFGRYVHPNRLKFILGGNLAGESCFWQAMPARDLTKSRCQENVNLEATRVLLAMRAYQAKHGRLPGDLAELVPEFIDAVPTDAFNGEPLHYLPGQKVIYSVGQNLKDDGGLISKDDHQLDYGISVDF
jgi:hypothetical protein